jgi:2-polyprenyl-3-methyl-5-hydroxy-6-metoxy-1,4-benzoquinol methylase
VSAYEWVDDSSSRPLRCRVCDFDGSAPVLLRFDVEGRGLHDAATCPSCGSIDLVPEPLGFTPDEASVDDYVELMGGLGTLAELIEVLAQAGGDRMLDVGCGYGFAIDYARWRHGWSVVGVEPSGVAARRGAAELLLDIRNEPLSRTTVTGEPFPLVLCTEVLEHVTDPRDLLVQIASRMTPDGTLLLTTPDAAVVSRDGDPGQIADVLSAGLHVFLASGRGLEDLLRKAGFGSIRATRNGLSHRVLARLDGTQPADPGYLPDITSDVLRYCRVRSRQVARPSALSIGLETRALRNASALGQFPGMRSDLRRVRSDLRRRTGVDLRDPARARRTLPVEPPRVLLSIAFSVGMRELLSGSPDSAAEWFQLAVDTGRSQLGAGGLRGSESRDLLLQSAMHLGLAQARRSPNAAVEVALGLLPRLVDQLGTTTAPLARWQSRIAVDLINLGRLTESAPLVELVGGAAPTLAMATGEDRVAGRDALLSLGVRALQLGATADARRWLERLLAIPDDGSAADREPRRVAATLLEGMGASPPTTTPAVVRSMIDRYWADPAGTFVDGWIHLDGEPGDGLWLDRGGARIPLPRHRRDDLLAFWPGSPNVVDAGFSAYVPGPPEPHLDFVITSADGERRARIPAPATRLPVCEVSERADVDARLIELLEQAPDGPALVIGGRLPEADSRSFHDDLLEGREVVGLDIHPGHGVDVVGDVHRLSDIVGDERFAVVFSASLLEHLTKPWLAALQMARVLKPGGLAIHLAPWAWPTHAQPNDFWRMSQWGLRQLFGEELGFEVVDAGEFGPVSIVPDPSWREPHLAMPTLDTGSTSWIVARKVDGRADTVTWPYDAERGASLAREYPIEALATSGRELP